MLVDFVGYAADCTVSGRIQLAGGRASDVIAAGGSLRVHDATLRSLLGTRRLFEHELVVEREELLAFKVSGTAGDPARRIRTVRHRLRAQVGPYVVLGELHVLPGASPLRSLRARKFIVPLTDATVLVPSDTGGDAMHASALLVNIAHISTVRLVAADDSASEPWSQLAATHALQLALPVGRG